MTDEEIAELIASTARRLAAEQLAAEPRVKAQALSIGMDLTPLLERFDEPLRIDGGAELLAAVLGELPRAIDALRSKLPEGVDLDPVTQVIAAGLAAITAAVTEAGQAAAEAHGEAARTIAAALDRNTEALSRGRRLVMDASGKIIGVEPS